MWVGNRGKFPLGSTKGHRSLRRRQRGLWDVGGTLGGERWEQRGSQAVEEMGHLALWVDWPLSLAGAGKFAVETTLLHRVNRRQKEAYFLLKLPKKVVTWWFCEQWNGCNTENKMVKVRKDTNTCWRLFYFALTTTFRGSPYHTHFVEEETEVQQSYFAKIIKLINGNKWQNQPSASLSVSRFQVPSSLSNYLHVSLAYWSGLSASLWASSSVSLPSYPLNKIIQ